MFLIIGEAAMISALMQSTSVMEHFMFYLYFDYALLTSLLVPFYIFSRYIKSDTAVTRNCLPIMCIWMLGFSVILLMEIMFVLLKDMSTVITDGR